VFKVYSPLPHLGEPVINMVLKSRGGREGSQLPQGLPNRWRNNIRRELRRRASQVFAPMRLRLNVVRTDMCLFLQLCRRRELALERGIVLRELPRGPLKGRSVLD